jgi:hypothetical protein
MKNIITIAILMQSISFSFAGTSVEVTEERISSLQSKIKEYESLIEKESADNISEEKKETDKLAKEALDRSSKINEINSSNEYIQNTIEKKISQTEELEKTISELIQKNEIETKAAREREKRKKMILESQKSITKHWLEQKDLIESTLSDLNSDEVSKFRCVVEVSTNDDGKVLSAEVTKPSNLGLFDGIAKKAIMESEHLNLPSDMRNASVIFTKNNATLRVKEDN